MPVWLAWLLPVPAATLAAVAWNAWAGRERRPLDVEETIAAHARFRAALSTPGAAGAPAPAVRTAPAGPVAPAQRVPTGDRPQGGPSERVLP